MNPLLNGISADPNVCFGKPCIKGTRIVLRLPTEPRCPGKGTSLDEYFGRRVAETCCSESLCLVTLDLDFSDVTRFPPIGKLAAA
jgi:hypothetical protein